MLAAAGYRVIVPFVRGYGPTCFLSGDTLRNGQQAALAVDVIALMDALGIEKASWPARLGGRSANVVAALWPDRSRALVSVSGYLISRQAPPRPRCRRRPSTSGRTSSLRHRPRPGQLRQVPAGVQQAHLAARLPGMGLDDATFARSTAAFDDPDHVAIVVHNYAGGSAWPGANRNTTTWSGDSLSLPPFRAPLSPSRATPTARRTPTPAPTPHVLGKYAHGWSRAGRDDLPQEAPQAFGQAAIDVDAFEPMTVTPPAVCCPTWNSCLRSRPSAAVITRPTV